jgi:hypothetical protein
MAKKKSLLGALLKKHRAKKETASKKRYLEHYKKAGSKALTYAQWKKEGEEPTYFKGPKHRKKTVEARLREYNRGRKK